MTAELAVPSLPTVFGQKMLLNARAQKGLEITQGLQTSDWLTLKFWGGVF